MVIARLKLSECESKVPICYEHTKSILLNCIIISKLTSMKRGGSQMGGIFLAMDAPIIVHTTKVSKGVRHGDYTGAPWWS